MGVHLFAENIIVSNSVIKCIEGEYVQEGSYNSKPCYINGDFEIRYKGCRAKWVLVHQDTMYYRNMNDLESCPLEGWLTACRVKGISDKIPQFEFYKVDLTNKKEEIK
jgi:hypothetical protein